MMQSAWNQCIICFFDAFVGRSFTNDKCKNMREHGKKMNETSVMRKKVKNNKSEEDKNELKQRKKPILLRGSKKW